MESKLSVLYADMIRTSAYINEDIQAAIGLQQRFQDNMIFAYLEKASGVSYLNNQNVSDLKDVFSEKTKSDYNKRVKESLKSTPLPNEDLERTLSSVIDLLPMSDSVFLTSKDVGMLTKQWCNLLVSCILSISDREIDTHKQYPLLFRSGISNGDYKILPTNGLLNQELFEHSNITGEGVVKSVRLAEYKRKGAYFFTDNETFKTFDKDLQSKCVKYNEQVYEILWPAFFFSDSNIEDCRTLRMEFENFVHKMFNPVIDLYKDFVDKRETSIAEQYKNILLMYGKSFLTYCSYLTEKRKGANISECGQKIFCEWLKEKTNLLRLVFEKYPL